MHNLSNRLCHYHKAWAEAVAVELSALPAYRCYVTQIIVIVSVHDEDWNVRNEAMLGAVTSQTAMSYLLPGLGLFLLHFVPWFISFFGNVNCLWPFSHSCFL